MQQGPFLQDIQHEIWADILTYLSPAEKVNFQQACHEANTLGMQDIIWQHYINRLHQIDPRIPTSAPPYAGPNWRANLIENVFPKLIQAQEREIKILQMAMPSLKNIIGDTHAKELSKLGSLNNKSIWEKITLFFSSMLSSPPSDSSERLALYSLKELEKRDALLNKINAALIKSSIDLNSKELNLSRHHLTRFPRCVFEDEELASYWKQLEILRCDMNSLKDLDLSSCPELKHLSCQRNRIKKLNIQGCSKLMTLNCGWNRLSNLDVRQFPQLTFLACNSNKLRQLHVKRCKKLNVLDCGFNPLTRLNARECSLSHLRVKGCQFLNYLDCQHNLLTQLDVSDCKRLLMLDCAYNQLSQLTLLRCDLLQQLFCEHNNLPELNVSDFKMLKYFKCNDNQLSMLNFSDCRYLKSVKCHNNRILNLTFADCPKLKFLKRDQERDGQTFIVSWGNLLRESGNKKRKLNNDNVNTTVAPLSSKIYEGEEEEQTYNISSDKTERHTDLKRKRQ